MKLPQIHLKITCDSQASMSDRVAGAVVGYPLGSIALTGNGPFLFSLARLGVAGPGRAWLGKVGQGTVLLKANEEASWLLKRKLKFLLLSRQYRSGYDR